MSVEDLIIEKLKLHRDLKNLLMEQLQAEGIECEETAFTDANGDILVLNPENGPQAQSLIRRLQQQISSKTNI